MKNVFSFSKSLILNCSVLILLAACGRKAAEPPADLGPPATVSDFILQNLASEFPGEIKTADCAGQVQLILFFRTDDDACRGALSDWNALQKEFAPRGFTLVGAIVDDRHPDVLAAETAALGPTFSVGLANARVVAAFGGPSAIRAIPTAFLLSRNGLPIRTYAGYEPLEALRDDIARALDGQALVDRRPQAVAPEDNAP